MFYDPTVACKTNTFSVIAGCMLLIFIFFLTTLLILYPTRLFRRCFSCFGFRRWHALQMFVESFQGQYKDGTNGTHDFRMVSASFLILRILILAFLLNHHYLKFNLLGQTLLLASVSSFYAITRPYKSNFMCTCDILILFLLEGLSVLTSIPITKNYLNYILGAMLLLGVPHMVLICNMFVTIN